MVVDFSKLPAGGLLGDLRWNSDIDTMRDAGDLVPLSQGNDTLLGGGGNDTIHGGLGADTMDGGAGDDTYIVDNTGDRVIENVSSGTDTVRASISYMLATSVENLVLTGSGHLNGTGNALNNRLTGNAGNNILDGGLGADTMDGGAGDDSLLGGDGNDRLFGGTGDDKLHAGTGADRLEGGRGKDQLYGGTDSAGDTFVFTSRYETQAASRDVIHNFTRGSDHIDLRGIDAWAGTSYSNEAFDWSGQRAEEHSVWWKAVDAGVVLRGDVNGDARADFEILVRDRSALGADDVLL